jgi:hypothetical protein
MTHPAWLRGASVAPSAHNTQPWQFTVLLDGRVQVGWKPARTLPIGDPTSRDLFLALGAAIESARLRALSEGERLRFEPAPDDLDSVVGWLIPGEADVFPLLERTGVREVTLARALNRRQTARGPHLPVPIPRDVREALVLQAHCYGRNLTIVTGQALIQRLAKLAGQATAALFADDAVHTELWRWLRLDPTDPAYQRDGLTADCLELAGPTRWLARQTMPPDRMRRLVRLGLHHLLAADTERVARRSSAICLLTTSTPARADLVETGRVLQRLWLLAATHDLTTHPLSALLDCAETIGPAVAACTGGANPAPTGPVGAGFAPPVLAAPATGLPAAIFRLGYTRPAARSPRLPLAELGMDTSL